MTAHRVLVCGGRDYCDQARLFAVLDHYRAQYPFEVVIQGAARGADTLAGEWADARGVPVLPFPADWGNLNAAPCEVRYRFDGTPYNAKAGSARNARMLREGRPTVVVAFPGGRGTADMIRQAKRAGVPVVEVPAS